MIKNKHAFTLIEVIGIVTILSLMLLLAVPAITKTLKRNEQKKYDDYLNNLKIASESYIVGKLKDGETIGDEHYVTLGNLIDTELIQETITNPENGGVLSRDTKIKATKNVTGTRDYSVEPHYLLPETYTLVDYISSTGTQYIDTLYKLNNNCDTELVISNLTMGSAGGGRFFGAWTSTTSNRYTFNIYNASYIAMGYNNTNSGETHLYNNEETKLASVGNKFYVNDVLKHEFNEESFETEYSAYLFATHIPEGTNAVNVGTLSVHSCKIWDNNVLVRDFVPCYRNSDNEVGMFDLVNFVFYTNKGTGSFEYGN